MPQLALHTSFGDLTVSEDEGYIVALDWGWPAFTEATPLLEDAVTQLQEYFSGDRTRFDLPLKPYGTPFQQSVWHELNQIPYGGTTTYGKISAALKSHPRAVGLACGRNPVPIIIPCHRVLTSTGTLGGYSGDGGINTKKQLLNLENISAFELS